MIVHETAIHQITVKFQLQFQLVHSIKEAVKGPEILNEKLFTIHVKFSYSYRYIVINQMNPRLLNEVYFI